jgi:iron complex outermembrane receptor protein
MVLSTTAHAQTLVGRVITTDGEPLELVQVVVERLDRGTVTDSNGRWLLDKLPLEPVRIEFRFVGFRPEFRVVDVVSGETEVNVVMQETRVDLAETVITAEGQADAMLKRSTRSVSILAPEDLDRTRGQTIGAMLAELPGVSVLSTGPSIAKPVIRGLHSQRLVVVNAGVQQEGQQWGGEHAPEIDPFSAGRVEVIRGAASVEYGVGAIGGIIRIEPEELPYNRGLGADLALNAFSNNRHGAVSTSVFSGLGPNWAWRMRTSARKAGDSRTPGYVIGNSGFQEFDAAGTVGFHSNRAGFRLHISHFGTTLGLYSGAHIGNYDDLLRAIERGRPAVDYAFTYDISAPKQRISHDAISLNGHIRLPSGDWLDAQLGFQSNRRSEFDAHRRFSDPDSDPAFSLALRTSSAEIKLRQRPRGGFIGSSGLSVTTQGNRNGESGFLIPNFRATTVGAFIHEMFVADAWTFDAGLRYDYRWLRAWPRENLSSGPFVRHDATYGSVSAIAGVIWRMDSAWSVSSNLGHAWRPPGVNELFNYGVHHGTAQFETGNPDLGVEQSWNLDVTLRHTSDVVTAELSVFRNRMDGYIFLYPDEEPRVTIRGTFPAFHYVQQDATLKGLDGWVEIHLAERFDVHLSSSIVRGTDRESDEPLVEMPSDRVRGGLEWSPLSDSRTSIHLDIIAVKRQDRVPEGVDYAPPPPGYSLVNVGISGFWALGSTPITWSLDVNNVFDTAYRDYMSRFRYFIDDPGRNVSLRMQLAFGSGS